MWETVTSYICRYVVSSSLAARAATTVAIRKVYLECTRCYIYLHDICVTLWANGLAIALAAAA